MSFLSSSHIFLLRPNLGRIFPPELATALFDPGPAGHQDAERDERTARPSCPPQKMTMADGNGADALAPPNRRRPRRKMICPCLAYLCHQTVSVRLGTRQTTVAPSLDSSSAFCMKAPMRRPYGGFIHTVPCHRCRSASCSFEKKRVHLVLHAEAHASRSK